MTPGSSDVSATSTYTDQPEVFNPAQNSIEVMVNRSADLIGKHWLIILSGLFIGILSFVLAAVLLT